METKLEQTLKSKQPGQLKTFAQAGMKDPMPAPLVIHGSTNNSVMAKTADTGMMPGMAGNTTQQPTFWYSPEMSSDSWLLPKSRIETLRFCKIYYNLDPYIHSILNMHAQYGFSKFTLQCKDPKYTKLYNTLFSWNPEFDWYQFALDVALSYYKYGEACLTGDTKIRVTDENDPEGTGIDVSLEELYNSNKTNFLVKSYDIETKTVVNKLADKVVLTKKDTPVLKIKFTNGQEVKCTPDHKFLIADGTYVDAIDLKVMKTPVISGYLLHPVYVSSIETFGTADVFDVKCVEDTHNFILDYGVVVHNCVWGSWNAARRTWDRLVLIDPALIEYKEDLFTGHATMELIPTVEMKQAVKEAILQGRQDIDPMLLDAVQNNKKLPLDTEGTEENVFTGQKYSPAKVFVFARRTDPSSTRGTSALVCLFRDMIYKDQLRMSQIAVAQKTQLPIELWTVGHLGSDEQSSILPGPEMLEEVRAMITNATQQPPYSIVYGPYLKYEALGVSGKLLDIYNDLGYVENQILVGLGVNKAVVLGEGPNVQGKAISLNRLIREYAVLRDLFESFMQKYVLLPIAKANNLVDEEGQYILPKLNWSVSLSPELDKERFDMCYKMWKDGLISTMSLFEKCPEKFDYILEMKRLEEERNSVYDKQDRRLGKPGTTPGAGGASAAPAGRTSGGNVRDGKGNPDLRDFALGGNNASAINDSSATGDTSVGDGASTPTGGI